MDLPPSAPGPAQALPERPLTTDVPLSAPNDIPPARTAANAHIVQLRLMFTAWITHFRSLGYIKDSTMELLDHSVCRQALELSVKDAKVREAIGRNPKIWSDYVDVFRAAIASLEQRSFGDPNNPANYDGPSSNVIVANSITLIKDIQRLDNVLALARNVLTCGARVQNLAAQVGFDSEVCSLINLCVKITARGYDGDGTTVEEDKWNAVVTGFKRLLITSLQFLSNLVTMNERLKLMLWVELFDSGSADGSMVDSIQGVLQAERDTQGWAGHTPNAFYARAKAPASSASIMRGEKDPLRWPDYRPFKPVTPFFFWLTYCASKIEEEIFLDKNPERIDSDYELEAHLSSVDLVAEGLERWRALDIGDRDQIAEKWDDIQVEPRFREHVISIEAWKDAGWPEDFEDDVPADKIVDCYCQAISLAESRTVHDRAEPKSKTGSDLPPIQDIFAPPTTTEPDYRMMVSAADGANKLQEGKTQLLKRLDLAWDVKVPPVEQMFSHGFDPAPKMRPERPASEPLPEEQEEEVYNADAITDETPEEAAKRAELLKRVRQAESRQKTLKAEVAKLSGEEIVAESEDGESDEAEDGSGRDGSEEEGEDEDEEEEEEDEEDEEEEEEDYAVPGEDGRGLLTDVPLILGPNEIVVLPMLIMSGIVPPTEAPNKQKDDYSLINMYTIRCHLLLAQENGRNLLRELLIFVAAWDLREEELYFKFMVKIMEAILVNGLMPFAYGAFKETKDIISPAQAVIMKLLTKIFHSRQAFIGAPTTLNTPFRQPGDIPSPTSPLRFDIQIVHCLFSEFRQNIVPQICALIFLQGAIRMRWADPQDFPLNLWDMERMYEGVYQYLEFFAILTDHDSWKQLMAEWEVTSELVTLLRELEVAIPHGQFVALPPVMPPPPLSHVERGLSMSVRHNFRPPTRTNTNMTDTSTAPVAVERPYDVNTSPQLHRVPAAVPALPLNPADPLPQLPDPNIAYTAEAQPLHDDPSDFEWRNLKKLCVLVLSSLVWKNKTLQDQVRQFGGIEAILYCCDYDEHNPYIREHAIMCLRFLLEGNEENQKVVRDFSAKNEERERARAAAQNRAATTGGAVSGMTANQAPRVPEEVLDQRGYETFMDGRGKVGLRRKDGTVVPGPPENQSLEFRDYILEGPLRGRAAANVTAAGIAGMAGAMRGGMATPHVSAQQQSFPNHMSPSPPPATPNSGMPNSVKGKISNRPPPPHQTQPQSQPLSRHATAPTSTRPTSQAQQPHLEPSSSTLPAIPVPNLNNIPTQVQNLPPLQIPPHTIEAMQAAAASIPKEAWDDRAVLDKLPGWMQLIVNLKEEMGALMAGVGGGAGASSVSGEVTGPFGVVGNGEAQGLQTRESIREAAESFVQKVLGEGGVVGAVEEGMMAQQQEAKEEEQEGAKKEKRVWDVGDML